MANTRGSTKDNPCTLPDSDDDIYPPKKDNDKAIAWTSTRQPSYFVIDDVDGELKESSEAIPALVRAPGRRKNRHKSNVAVGPSSSTTPEADSTGNLPARTPYTSNQREVIPISSDEEVPLVVKHGRPQNTGITFTSGRTPTPASSLQGLPLLGETSLPSRPNAASPRPHLPQSVTPGPSNAPLPPTQSTARRPSPKSPRTATLLSALPREDVQTTDAKNACDQTPLADPTEHEVVGQDTAPLPRLSPLPQVSTTCTPRLADVARSEMESRKPSQPAGKLPVNELDREQITFRHVEGSASSTERAARDSAAKTTTLPEVPKNKPDSEAPIGPNKQQKPKRMKRALPDPRKQKRPTDLVPKQPHSREDHGRASRQGNSSPDDLLKARSVQTSGNLGSGEKALTAADAVTDTEISGALTAQSTSMGVSAPPAPVPAPTFIAHPAPSFQVRSMAKSSAVTDSSFADTADPGNDLSEPTIEKEEFNGSSSLIVDVSDISIVRSVVDVSLRRHLDERYDDHAYLTKVTCKSYPILHTLTYRRTHCGVREHATNETFAKSLAEDGEQCPHCRRITYKPHRHSKTWHPYRPLSARATTKIVSRTSPKRSSPERFQRAPLSSPPGVRLQRFSSLKRFGFRHSRNTSACGPIFWLTTNPS
jgi:hypothetical protein